MTRKTRSRAARTHAIDGFDRSFFLWLLASLVMATMISGVVAMWAVMSNAPPFG
ncbi:MAG: hypothetical protein AB7S92_07795 [Parvibaculaceae bacterium]